VVPKLLLDGLWSALGTTVLNLEKRGGIPKYDVAGVATASAPEKYSRTSPPDV